MTQPLSPHPQTLSSQAAEEQHTLVELYSIPGIICPLPLPPPLPSPHPVVGTVQQQHVLTTRTEGPFSTCKSVLRTPPTAARPTLLFGLDGTLLEEVGLAVIESDSDTGLLVRRQPVVLRPGAAAFLQALDALYEVVFWTRCGSGRAAALVDLVERVLLGRPSSPYHYRQLLLPQREGALLARLGGGADTAGWSPAALHIQQHLCEGSHYVLSCWQPLGANGASSHGVELTVVDPVRFEAALHRAVTTTVLFEAKGRHFCPGLPLPRQAVRVPPYQCGERDDAVLAAALAQLMKRAATLTRKPRSKEEERSTEEEEEEN